MPPLCSIIIPTFNTRELTLRCLSALVRDLPADRYEIVVVDNHSTDETFDAVGAQFPNVKRIALATNAGFARACNQGAREASGAALLFLNSDTRPQPGAIATLLRWLEEHPETAIVGPQLIGPRGHILQMSWGWVPLFFQEIALQFLSPKNLLNSVFRRKLVEQLQTHPRAVAWVSGACLMVRREIFRSLQGFDESYELYFEDVDLCCRAREDGGQVDFVPHAQVVHYLGQSVRQNPSLIALIYQQSHITFYRRYGSSIALFFLKAYLLAKWLLTNPRRPNSDPRQLRQYLESYLAVILERRKIQLKNVA